MDFHPELNFAPGIDLGSTIKLQCKHSLIIKISIFSIVNGVVKHFLLIMEIERLQ